MHSASKTTSVALRALVLLLALSVTNAFAGAFTRTGDMTIGRDYAMAVTLADGRALIVGGVGTHEYPNEFEASAEIYDPATGKFTATGSMSVSRDGNATATLLEDGRALVAGGAAREYRVSAELYDPATGQFTRTGDPLGARIFATAIRLLDGRVLIAGGRDDENQLNTAELYDPATGEFTPTGSMALRRGSATAALLPDGRALIAGGLSLDEGFALASAEIYDPATGQFTLIGDMSNERYFAATATMADGRVLIAGGADDERLVFEAEVYDPATGAFSRAGPLQRGRMDHAAAALADGGVLIVGGSDQDNIPTTVAEVFDAATGQFTPTGGMGEGRIRPAVARLADGRVLVAGGMRAGTPPIASAEIYDPDAIEIDYADLNVDIAASAKTVRPGERLSFVATLTNRGPDRAEGVEARIAVPSEVAIDRVRVKAGYPRGEWSCATRGSRVSCVPVDGGLPMSGPGRFQAKVSILVEATVSATAPPGPIRAVGSVSATGTDVNPADNRHHATVRVTSSKRIRPTLSRAR